MRQLVFYALSGKAVYYAIRLKIEVFITARVMMAIFRNEKSKKNF